MAELRPWPRNPRRIRPERLEQLKAMLVASPEMLRARPLIALLDGTVIAGNQRLAAVTELGWETVPCVYVDLDEQTATRWAFADNNPMGETDDAAAAQLLAELQADDLDLLLTGFAPDETSRLLAVLNRRDVDPDAAPGVPAIPKSKRGVVYELGYHRVMCGDATSEDDVRALFTGSMQDGVSNVEVMWTDPPYGVDYVGKTGDALTIANDTATGLRALLEDAFRLADRAMAPSARFYCAAPAGPHNLEFRLAIQAVGWRFHEGLVWVKDVFVLGHSDYHLRHEDILYGWKGGEGRPGRGRHTGSRWEGDHAQASVFEVQRPKRSADHPMMKPVALIEAQLANSARPGDAIYDPFLGSGSTLVACEILGMRCYGIELEPAYCDVIRQRYADYVGDQKWAP